MENIRGKQKIILTVILSALLMVSCKTQDEYTESEENEEVVTLNICCFIEGNVEDAENVVEKINEITVSEIGAKIHVDYMGQNEYFSKYKQIVSGAEDIDLITSFYDYASEAAYQGLFYPLDNLIEEYGSDLRLLYSDHDWDASKINNTIYGIPSGQSVSWVVGFEYNMKVAELLNLDLSHVEKMEDWGEILKTVHQEYPQMYGVVSAMGSNIGNGMNPSNEWDGLIDSLGVIVYNEDTDNIVNLFETETYESYLKMWRSWYENGYIQPDMATTTDTFYELEKEDKAFSAFVGMSSYDMYKYQENNSEEIGFVQIGKPHKFTGSAGRVQWNVLADSKHPDIAIKFLNLLAADQELADLFLYGEKGVNYQVKGDGTYTFVDGESEANAVYHPKLTLPNQYIAGIWESMRDVQTVKDLVKKADDDAIESPVYGFCFNTSTVTGQIISCRKVMDKYVDLLESGVVDLDKVLPKFREELKSAGIDEIVQEKQIQYSEFLKGN